MIHVTSTENGKSRSVKLEGTCDVRVAHKLHAALQEVCSDGLPTHVDCSAIESIDTAFIQLLIAAKRDALNSFEIQCSDSEAIRWMQLAGVADYLTSTERNVTQRTPTITTSNS